MATLILTEKPNVASRIANSLGNPETLVRNKVNYYHLKKEDEEVFVVPTVGHVYGLKQKKGKWEYPVFDVEWLEAYKINKQAAFTKKYISNLKFLGKKADKIINACDYDIEGSVIGYNVIRFACGGDKKEVKRMKFSTLTTSDILDAFDNLNELDSEMIEAGLTRHFLDFYYGVNLSRALTLAIKSVGRFKILSSGRVQGPTLEILAKKEKEIMKFKSKPYWQIELQTKDFSAIYKKDLWDKKDAEEIIKKCEKKEAMVSKIERRQIKNLPPTPFNLTDLQIESYKLFRVSPSITQRIAQELYTLALISYPRTSSQKLPGKLGLKKILEKLGKQKEYKKIVGKVLEKSVLNPREGKKIDEAHPAIHPTGEVPKTLNEQQRKVYDLIVKRFISTFGDAATRETMRVVLDIEQNWFLVNGARTVEAGWFSLYSPYILLKEIILPGLKEGQKVDVSKLNLLDKETQPPKRYSQASIIKELESRNLGTKSTRAEIINGLYNRRYIEETSIKVTKLGLKVVDTLTKYSPEIISEELTRKFEEEMESVRRGEYSRENVLKGAREKITNILKPFKEHEKEIGKELLEAFYKTIEDQSNLGKCLECGGNLKIMRSRKGGQFVGCSGYPKCKNIYPLPGYGLIKKANKVCKECGTPIVLVIRKGKRPWKMCIDPKCKTKENWSKTNASDNQ